MSQTLYEIKKLKLEEKWDEESAALMKERLFSFNDYEKNAKEGFLAGMIAGIAIGILITALVWVVASR